MALTEEQRNPWRAIVAGGDYNLTSQDWEDLLTELDSLYTEAPIAQPASAPSEQKPVYQFRPECENWIDCTEQFYESWRGEKRELYAAHQPDYKAQREAELYRWLRDHNKSWSWNPSRYNREIISGFASFNTGYLGFEFEAAIDAAMKG